MTTTERRAYKTRWEANKRAAAEGRLDVWRWQTVHLCPHCDKALGLSWDGARRVKYCYCQTPPYILEYDAL